MQLLFLHSFLQGNMPKSICWTLVHSLWQGLLAAALAGIVILATKKTVARIRYNLLGIVLILFIGANIITFFSQLSAEQRSGKSSIEITGAIRESFVDVTDQAAVPAIATLDKLIQLLNQKADLIVLIWFAFFFLHCLKLMTGLAGITRLRSYRAHPAEDYWRTKLSELGITLGIQRSIRLLESELIKVPVAIGFLKPVILLPVGMLSNLPVTQVETILLHELAHIRRKDYVINILQRFAEAIYFFNPALLWISSLIRQEREACCDDIVLANTHHKGSYLEALVSFQEYSMNASGYVMAIGHKKNHLLHRVKRMLTRENKKLNLMEKLLLITGLSALAAFTFIPQKENILAVTAPSATVVHVAKTEPTEMTKTVVSKTIPAYSKRKSIKKETENVATSPAITLKRDTVPSPKEDEIKETTKSLFNSISSSINNDGKTKTEMTTVVDNNGKKYAYTKVNDKLTSLSIDGKTVPESEFGNYSDILAQIDKAREENKVQRLRNIQVRREDMTRRTEEMRNMAMSRQREQREYMERQRQYLQDRNNQNKQYEKTRRAYEQRQQEMMRRTLEKQRRLERVPRINGREVIKNDIHTNNNNEVIADVNTKMGVLTGLNADLSSSAATKLINLKNNILVTDNSNLHLNTSLNTAMNLKPGHLETKPNIDIKLSKTYRYEPAPSKDPVMNGQKPRTEAGRQVIPGKPSMPASRNVRKRVTT